VGSTAGGVQILDGGAITPGWHYLVGTYDGTTARLYLDATLQATTLTNYTPNPSQTLTIGMNDNGSDYPYNGTLDELALYNTPLTPTTITQHYNTGTGH
jgi:hypothetical protein